MHALRSCHIRSRRSPAIGRERVAALLADAIALHLLRGPWKVHRRRLEHAEVADPGRLRNKPGEVALGGDDPADLLPLLPELMRSTHDVALVFAGLEIPSSRGRRSAPAIDCPLVVLALRMATSVTVDLVHGEAKAFEYGAPFAGDDDVDSDDDDSATILDDDDDSTSELSLRDAIVLGANAPEPTALPAAHPLRRWLERNLGILVTGSVR